MRFAPQGVAATAMIHGPNVTNLNPASHAVPAVTGDGSPGTAGRRRRSVQCPSPVCARELRLAPALQSWAPEMLDLHRPRSLLVLASVLLLACDPAGGSSNDDGDGGGGGADASVAALIDDAIEQSNDNIEIVCDCWDEAGFTSRGACLEDQILPAQRRCVEDAYARDAAASRLYLECVVPLMRELGTCLDARLDCVDPSTVDACFADFDLGRESCVQVPLSVQRALDDCNPVDGTDSGGAPGPDPGTDPGSDPPPPPPAPSDDPPTDPPAPAPGG